ncbi:MAG: hypothetical protein ACYSSK_02055 [Planctomycetota bacterium]
MRKTSRRKKRVEKRLPAEGSLSRPLELELDSKHRDTFHLLVLLGFGTFLSILYFGHQTVPNSDFIAFFRTGEQVLSGQLPTSFKRLPGLGVLQVLVSYCIPSSCTVHPSLMAGWIINSVLYVGTGLCLYKVVRQVLGSSAIWYCLLILINPMMLKWMRSPIVETSFTFCIVLTFVFIMKGTRWAYVFAVIACMFRYEGAFLIPVCFFMDFFSSKTARQKIFSFLRAGLTALPLATWMLLTILRRKEGTSIGRLDYIRNYNPDKGMVIGKFSNYVWDNSIRCFTFHPDPSTQGTIFTISKILLIVALLAGLAYAIYKKQWKPLGLMTFFIIFYIMHATRTYTMPRYGFPAIWVTVLLVWYGFQSIWEFCDERKWIPELVKYIVPIITIIVSLWWGIYLRTQQVSERQFYYQVQGQFISQRSAHIPVITMSVVLVVLIGGFLLFRKIRSFNFKKTLSALALVAVMFFAVTSNQFYLSRKVGNGAMDKEFKMLADWYRENAMGKKMICTMSHVMDLYLPESDQVKMYRYSKIKGSTPEDFVKDCIRQRIDYVAWDSRIGYSPKNKYYRLWKMQRVAFMIKPQDWGPLKFVKKIQNEYYPNRFINIYKLQHPEQLQEIGIQ